MINFNRESVGKMEELTKGKTISRIHIKDGSHSDTLVISFTDGTELHIDYEWIFEFDLLTHRTGHRRIEVSK